MHNELWLIRVRVHRSLGKLLNAMTVLRELVSVGVEQPFLCDAEQYCFVSSGRTAVHAGNAKSFPAHI